MVSGGAWLGCGCLAWLGLWLLGLCCVHTHTRAHTGILNCLTNLVTAVLGLNCCRSPTSTKCFVLGPRAIRREDSSNSAASSTITTSGARAEANAACRANAVEVMPTTLADLSAVR